MRSEMNFGLRRGKFPRMRKRAGFSLIIVLIISIVGLAIIAATMQMTVLSTGSGRVVSAGNTKYNFMQDAVQLGKAILKRSMDDCDDPPVYKVKGDKITKVDDLLIGCKYCALGSEPVLPASWKFECWVISKTLNRADLGKLGIAGNEGELEVKIYDMQYEPSDVELIDTADEKMLPPSIKLFGSTTPGGYKGESGQVSYNTSPDGTPGGGGGGGGPPKQPSNAGVYLIRATLTIDNNKQTILDTAVVQANQPEA